MENYKDLEEANKEVDRSKVDLHNQQSSNDDSGKEFEGQAESENEVKEEGSGIFTVDGKELPQIEGGYDLIDPGGSLGDDSLVSI